MLLNDVRELGDNCRDCKVPLRTHSTIILWFSAFASAACFLYIRTHRDGMRKRADALPPSRLSYWMFGW